MRFHKNINKHGCAHVKLPWPSRKILFLFILNKGTDPNKSATPLSQPSLRNATDIIFMWKKSQNRGPEQSLYIYIYIFISLFPNNTDPAEKLSLNFWRQPLETLIAPHITLLSPIMEDSFVLEFYQGVSI